MKEGKFYAFKLQATLIGQRSVHSGHCEMPTLPADHGFSISQLHGQTAQEFKMTVLSRCFMQILAGLGQEKYYKWKPMSETLVLKCCSPDVL